MRGRRKIRKWMVWSSASLVLTCLLVPAGPASAQPRHIRHAGPRLHHGITVGRLPAGHHVITVKNVGYRYSSGIFYRPQGRGWIVVKPPTGAVVAALTA